MPSEVTSSHFRVTLESRGKSLTVPAVRAAASYYFVDFTVRRRTRISVTADSDDYWKRGVDVQPWRLGIRPTVQGRTISFELDRPAKISVTRPGDYLGGAEMLFLFAESEGKKAPKRDEPGLRYYRPGIHRENIDARSGDRIYLAPGAVIFGSLNLWDVEDVRVSGRGMIVYDGPQNPADDEGWMHKKNWHAIVMHNARNISIEGITCAVRSRTWMIQMKDSRGIRFEDIKVIGGSAGNANQDGMDWLGGGDTVVSNSFFRAADDVFAMQGNWEGYSAEAMAIPGHEVSDIVLENNVLSTSISNVVRAGWPHKSFDSHHFVMRNTDVLHMGIGGCGVPFALLAIWADPGGTGKHSDYLFDNIRMDDWYSLVQLRQPAPGIENIRFRDVFGLETPSLVPSALLGNISGVSFENVILANQVVSADREMPLEVLGGAGEPVYNAAGAARASFAYAPASVSPGVAVTFEAVPPRRGGAKIKRYEWTFGDGTHASGRRVRHVFPDEGGTSLDGSGRFRVLLHVTDKSGHESWADEPAVVKTRFEDPTVVTETVPGLGYRYYEPDAPAIEEMEAGEPTARGTALVIDSSHRQREDHYGMAFEGYIDIPEDGGYTFTLLSNDAGQLEVDGTVLATSPSPWPQVCGSSGNAVRPATGSIGLRKGHHRIRVAETHSTGEDGFDVLWQGPGIELSRVPQGALSHAAAEDETNGSFGGTDAVGACR